MNKNIIISILFALVLAGTAGWLNELSTRKASDINHSTIINDYRMEIDALADSERRSVDTAMKYINLWEAQSKTSDSLQNVTVEQKKEIDNIPNILAGMVPSEAYDSLQGLLPKATEDLDYCFDGNQTKRLYEDELTLQKLKPMIVTCEEFMTSASAEIFDLKMAFNSMEVAKDSCNVRFEKAEGIIDEKDEQIAEEEGKTKKWKWGAIGLAVLLGLSLL